LIMRSSLDVAETTSGSARFQVGRGWEGAPALLLVVIGRPTVTSAAAFGGQLP
jgi:hypothetical protein